MMGRYPHQAPPAPVRSAPAIPATSRASTLPPYSFTLIPGFFELWFGDPALPTSCEVHVNPDADVRTFTPNGCPPK